MDEAEILEQRYRFFAEKAVQIAVDYSKTLVTLFTAIIAGLIALVAYQRVGFWPGVAFLIADFLAVLGLAFCLAHMSMASKLMSCYAALFAGEENVPNLLLGEEATEQAIGRFKRYAQYCHLSQLTYLLLTVVVGAVGLAAMLWDQIRVIGLMLAILIAMILVAAVLLQTIRRRRPTGSANGDAAPE